MSTVLCPHLVALDSATCNSISCRASHNHSPAFCDPCKAVHAEAHTSVHLGSVAHRLRVEAPVAPVRCIVCAPLGAEALAQHLFVGPEHYAAHARTSAHRAKLAKLPVTALAKPTRSKTDSGLGLGRPGIPGSGDARAFALERPYAPRAPSMPRLDLTSPPNSRGVTPAPGSRPVTSMSFGPGAAEALAAPPPGPPPMALGPSEYVLCSLCHVVLPVPPVDQAHKHGSTDPRLRIASGSDVTVRGSKNDKQDENDTITNDIHDDDTTTVSVLTTTENETDARKSLVLANHNANDKEHARRVRFPKFRAAWEKLARRAREREGRASGSEGSGGRLAIADREEAQRSSPEEREERGAEEPRPDEEDASRFATGDTSALTMSPGQLSLSSLSASPSVAVLGLDEEDEVGYTRENEEEYAEEQRYEDERYEGREYGQPLTAVEEEDDERSQISRPRSFTQSSSPTSEGVVELGGGYAGITIPAHLLPYLSPLTPSTELQGSPSPPETPIRAPSLPPFSFPPPPPPLPNQVTPNRGRTLDVPRPRPSPSVSARSQPYEPSPSPPPRLAFDDYGRVIKLGMSGWEPQDPDAESGFAKQSELGDGSESGSEPVREEREESEGEGAPPVVSSLSIKRYPIGRNGTIMPPRPTAAPAPVIEPTWERGPLRESISSFSANARPVRTVSGSSLGLGFGSTSGGGAQGQRAVSGGAQRSATTVPQRASTMAPQRNVSDSSTSTARGATTTARGPTTAPIVTTRGPTTTATRPVAPRQSTSEWALLGGAAAVPAPAPIPALSPGSSARGQGSRPVSRAQTDSRPGSRMNKFVNSPEVLSAIGDGEEEVREREGYFNRRQTAVGNGSGRSSPSEASQVIRALQSPEWASGPSLELGFGLDKDIEARRRRAMSSSSSGMFGPASPSPPMRSKPHLSPQPTSHSYSNESPARSFASPTPSRPFSPTQAWKGLTPPSPRSSSSVSDIRSPSLSSVGEGVEAEGEFAIKPFDEAQFLSDLGFGTARALGGPGAGTGPSVGDGASMGAGVSVGFGTGSGQSVAAALSPPVVEPSPPPAGSSSSPPLIPLPRPTSPLLSRASSPLARRLSPSPPVHGFGTSPPGVVRVSSPLARLAISSSSPEGLPAPGSPAPVRTTSSPIPAPSPPTPEPTPAARPATKTRVRSRPMGTSASVVGSVFSAAGPESIVSGYGGRSVVSGIGGQWAVDQSVVSGGGGQSVVSGSGGHSVVSGAGKVSVASGTVGTSVVTAPQSVVSDSQPVPEVIEEPLVISNVEQAESVVPKAGDETEDPRIEVLSVRSGSVVPRARSEAVAAENPTEQVAEGRVEPSTVAAPKSIVSEHHPRGKAYSLMSSSEAPSSVVSPLSPRLVAALKSNGIEVAMDEPVVSGENDQEVEGVIEGLAGMNLYGAPPPPEEDPIGTIEIIDAHSSGFTSPIVPEGAPSTVGSLFSRAASPKPSPFVPRFSLGRTGGSRSNTPTRLPAGSSPAPATPKAVRIVQGLHDTPGSARSHRPAAPGSSIERPDSAMAAARVPAPASIFSSHSNAHDAAQVPAPASVFSTGPGGASERRISVDPAHIPAPGSVFSRGPGSVFSARGRLSGEHRLHPVDSSPAFGSLMGHMQSPVMSQPPSGMSLEPHEAIAVEQHEPTGKVAGSPGFHTPAGQASPDVDQSRTPANERITPTTSPVPSHTQEEPIENDNMADEEAGPEDYEGGLTSSSEEGARDDDARTATAEDDGLDHLTESIGEPFGLQFDNTPGQSPMLEQPAFDPARANRAQGYRVMPSAPLFESPKHTMMTSPKLPGGFLPEGQPLSVSPSLIPSTDPALLEVLHEEDPMPEEVLALNPVICDACIAPMPLAKWTEHISKLNHRRNAARYSQYVFQYTTTDRDTSSPSNGQTTSRGDPALDARERWAEATRIQPRPARPNEYKFCDVCAVFLVPGDFEHFQGKRHLRCVRVAALDDAAELESVRGSVSDEEDGPAAIRAMREAAAREGVTPDWTKPRMRSRKSIGAAQAKLGQMAFQPVGAGGQNGDGEAWPPSDQSVSLVPQSIERGQMGWDI